MANNSLPFLRAQFPLTFRSESEGRLRRRWSPGVQRPEDGKGSRHGLSIYSAPRSPYVVFTWHSEPGCTVLLLSLSSNEAIEAQRGLLETTHGKARVQT